MISMIITFEGMEIEIIKYSYKNFKGKNQSFDKASKISSATALLLFKG